MRVKVLCPRDVDHRMLERWRRAHAADPARAHPFVSPDFVRAVSEVRQGVRVAVMQDAAGRAGWFAFEAESRSMAGPVGSGLVSTGGVLAEPGFTWDAERVLDRCGLVRWRCVTLPHPLPAPRVSARPGAGRGVRLGTVPNYVVDLSGGLDATYEQVRTRSRRLLNRLRGFERKLERAGTPVEFAPDTPDAEALDLLLARKAVQYRRIGIRDWISRPDIAVLAHRLIRLRSPTCSGGVSVLRIGDVPVGFALSLRSPTVVAGLETVYEPAYARWSPGLMTLVRHIESSARDGIVSYDLGPGAQAYKQVLAGEPELLGDRLFVRSNAAGFAVLGASMGVRRLREAEVTRRLVAGVRAARAGRAASGARPAGPARA